MDNKFNKKKFPTFDGDFWMYLLIPLVPMVVICYLPSILVQPGRLDFTDTGEIGDTIGGIMSPFVAMIAALLTFIAFWIQYKANIQQRQDIALERFERNFFELLNAQQQITDGLVLEDLNSNFKQSGRDVFQMLYLGEDYLNNDNKEASLRDLLKEDEGMKTRMANFSHIWFLDHYFRHLYRIYKYIDEYDESVVTDEMKQFYGAIMRSTLSPFELVMLFYNGFTHPKFKKLIEKYHVLNNLRIELLASDADRTLYQEMVASDDEIVTELGIYDKSAFRAK